MKNKFTSAVKARRFFRPACPESGKHTAVSTASIKVPINRLHVRVHDGENNWAARQCHNSYCPFGTDLQTLCFLDTPRDTQ